MPPAHSDHGTVLTPNEAALVVDSGGEARLCLPGYTDDEEVPRHVLFLTAVMMKLGDEVWVDQFIADCFERG